MNWTSAEEAAWQKAMGASQNGGGPAGQPTAAGQALTESRVDLVGLIREGVPEPTYVPGCEQWLRAGKRYLCPAPAGVGKSLCWLNIAVTVVEAGGSVVILDVENGADEYARRLEDMLAARDPSLADGCQQRLHYHAWPALSLSWTAEDWGAAVAGADLVIFDSSRMALSAVGLAENDADDYGKFAASLIMPLSRAGTTTVILDNTGHENKDRARGTIAKEDLNEVVYRLVVHSAFDRDRAGQVRLIRGRTRFAGLPREIRVELGGGTYRAPAVIADHVDEQGEREFRPTVLMERVSRAVEDQPDMTTNDIRAEVKGDNNAKTTALRILVREGYIAEAGTGQKRTHRSLKPYREDDDQPR